MINNKCIAMFLFHWQKCYGYVFMRYLFIHIVGYWRHSTLRVSILLKHYFKCVINYSSHSSVWFCIIIMVSLTLCYSTFALALSSNDTANINLIYLIERAEITLFFIKGIIIFLNCRSIT